MNIKPSLLLSISLALLLPGCGGMQVWPFDHGSSSGQSRTPANSTEYQCSNGKHFYVRLLDNGNTAWLIYPDREVGLNKSGSAGNRYSNGVAVLDLTGNDATLTDGASINYSGCKTVAK
jgi:membrane-bound inhibitor of C-type lysozyme